jgi:hypothetical protein
LPYPYVERIDSPLIAWMRNLIKKGRPWWDVVEIISKPHTNFWARIGISGSCMLI